MSSPLLRAQTSCPLLRAQPFSLVLPWLPLLSLLLCLLLPWRPAFGQSYANTSYPFAWIDATSHTKVGHNTLPYRFNGTLGISACGTTPPILDDTISDAIPIGFTFTYAGTNFTSLRIMSNGRLQFGSSNTTCGFGSPGANLALSQCVTHLHHAHLWQ